MVDFDVNIRLEAGSAQAQLRQMERSLRDVEREANGAGRTINAMENRLQDLTNELKNTEVGSKRFRELTGEIDRTERALNKATGAAKNVGGGFNLAQAAATGFVTALSTAAINAATAAIQNLGAAAAGSVKTFMDFEKSMNNVAALSGATNEEFAKLEEKAKELGATTVFSSSEVADAMGFLAQAGFTTDQILASTGATLELAAAGQLDLARAADIAANTMSQFNIQAQDTERVTNLLAAAAAASNTDVEQLSEAMKYLGPTAQSLGISIEETAAIIGVLGNSGIQGSLAGRALGTALVRLTNPTDQVAAAMKELNLQIDNGNGGFVTFQELLAQIERATADYTQTQKAAVLSTLLGSDAYQEINILLGEGSEAFGKFTDSITGTNRAQEIAEIQTRGLSGTMDELSSSTEALGIEVGSALSPAIEALANKASEAILQLLGQEGATNDLRTASEQLADYINRIDTSTVVAQLQRVLSVLTAIIDTAEAAARALQATTDPEFRKIEQRVAANQQAETLRSQGRFWGPNPYPELSTEFYGPGATERRNLQQRAFATGGIITGPTLALMGEAGMNEAVVPLPNGRSIPVEVRGGSGELTFDAPKMAQVIAQAVRGVYVEGNIGPTSTGEHFHVNKSDSGYFERNSLDQYVRVNGRPLSSGVTVPGGRFGAPRSYGGHSGWDYAFGAGRHELSLINGAEWVSNQPGTANGDRTTFRTPDGRQFYLLHGRFEGGALPRSSGASGTSAQNGMTDAQREAQRAEEERRRRIEQFAETQKRETEQLRDANEELKFRNEYIDKEIELYRTGQPIKDEAVKLLEVQADAAWMLQERQNELNEAVKAGLITTANSKTAYEEYKKAVEENVKLKEQEIEKERLLSAEREKYEGLIRYREEYERTTEAMREQLADLQGEGAMIDFARNQATLTGFDTAETQQAIEIQQAWIAVQRELQVAIEELNTTYEVGKMGLEEYQEKYRELISLGEQQFQQSVANIVANDQFVTATEQATAALARQQEVVQLLTDGFTNMAINVISGAEGIVDALGQVLRSLLQLLAQRAFTSLFGNFFGGIFGTPVASANGNVLRGGFQAFANGGVVTKPTLGLVGEGAFNEAIVPLPDGRSIPVIMRGGGGTNITVNVTTSGGETDGRRLGRQISEAIRAELVAQKRTGGLLSR